MGTSGVRLAFLALMMTILALLAMPGAGRALADGVPARLGVIRSPGEAQITVGGRDGGARLLPGPGPNQLEIEATRPFAPDAAARLAQLRDLAPGVSVDGTRLRLELAPGVITASWMGVWGQLTLSLRAGPPTAAPASAPPPPPTATQEPEPARKRKPAEPARSPRPVATAAAPTAPVPVPKPTPPAIEPAAATPAVTAVPVLPTTPPAASKPSTPKPPAPLPEPAAGPPPVINVTGRGDADGAELRIAWPEAVPAAVFQRAGVLWTVFAAPPGTLQGWDKLAAPVLGGWLAPIEQRRAGELQLFRLELRRPARVTAERDGSAWRIGVAPPPRPDLPVAPVGLTRDAGDGTIRSALPARNFAVTDPATGEELGLVLPLAASFRQPTAVRLVDVELLASAEGLAWHGLTDGVTVSAGRDGFALGRPGGLRLSTDLAGLPAAAAAETAEPAGPEDWLALAPRPLGLDRLGGTTLQERQRARVEITARLPGLAGLPQAAARLSLARLLLAEGLGQEAGVALARLDARGLDARAAASVREALEALDAAAAALAGRPETALTGLRARGLEGDREGALWRAFAAARAERPELVAADWTQGGPVLDAYPAPLRLILGKVVAASLARHGDPHQARALIDRLRPLAPDAATRAELMLLRGESAVRSGQLPLAEQALADARGGSGDTRLLADYLRTMSRHEQGKLDSGAAAAELAGQRPAWRGHPAEARMLRGLAELQAVAGDPMAALATTLDLITRSEAPARPEAEAAARDRLAELLQAAAEGRIEPLTAAAVERSHPGLLAQDPRGPDLRRRLARRVAEAGLPETAAEILGMDDAGGGDLEALAAARLAIANAFATLGDPARGMARLEGQAAPAVLRARAALQRGQPVEALAALAGVEGDTADELRRAAGLARQDWPAVALASEAVLRRAGSEGILTPARADALVWLALARARLGDGAAVAGLVAGYAQRLPDGAWRALLRLVADAAQPTAAGVPAPAAAASLVQTIGKALGALPALPAPPAATLRTAAAG
ncbi:MAG: hypothetical protein U1E17_05595 [Geminicoccaceae bacterium]